MQQKVKTALYLKSLNKVASLKGHNEEIKELLRYIEIEFFQSEEIIMQQYDDFFRKIHITGAGICNVYMYFDARNRVCLG